MKALIELLIVFIQVAVSWVYTSCLTFGMRFLIVILSGIFGWIVGLLFGETILAILAQLGITGFSMAQIGIFLGFICCFFSPIVRYKNQTNETDNTNVNYLKIKNYVRPK